MKGALAPDLAMTGGTQSRTGAAQLFLSHASEDAEAARELAGHLRGGGISVWLDLDELRPGDDWMNRLEEGLLGCEHFAVYIGRLGIVRWISREVRVALDRNAKDGQFKVIPILGPGADPAALPAFLQQHHWLDLRDREVNPASVVGLVLDLLGLPAKRISSDEAPFVGLRAFDAQDAHLFFGRDREIAELLERLSSTPFLAMIGDSGSGKSSLLRAGLLPSLRSGSHTLNESPTAVWRVGLMRPGTDPFRELANALADLLPEPDAATKLGVLQQCHQQLAAGSEALAQCIGALVPVGYRTVLAIDQFEELFTLVSEDAVRQRFIETLFHAATNQGDRPVHIVITLRADFYPECLQYPALSRAMTSCQYVVRPITGNALMEVIEKPAARTGVSLEEGLVEAILEEIGPGGGSLPLLEHTLLQLWNRRSSDTLTHRAYESIGRVRGALEYHAEKVFASFTSAEQIQTRKLLLRLVQPGKNSGATGRRATSESLLPSGREHDLAESVLSKLVEQRAVNIYGTGEVEEYGLAHEALLYGWQRLNDWLNEDREFLFWRQRLNSALTAWEESAGDSGALLRGAPLVEASRWYQQRGEDLSESATRFIEESTRKEYRFHWLKRAAVAGLATLAVTAVVAAYFAVSSRNEAEQNLQLATSAVDQMLTRVGSETLKDIPQLEGIRKDLLAQARALYEQLAQQPSRSPELQLQAALVNAGVAEIDRQLSDRTSAVKGLQESLKALGGLVADHPQNHQFMAALAIIHNQLGRVLGTLGDGAGDWQLAEQHYLESIELHQTLRQSASENMAYRLDHGLAYLNRGILFKEKLDDRVLAERYLKQSIELVEEAENPGSGLEPEVNQHLARSHNTLANLVAEQGETQEALSNYQISVHFFRALHEAFPGSREYREELAKTYNNMAITELRGIGASSTANVAQALAYNAQAIALFEGLAEPLPARWVELANAYRTKGGALLIENRPLDAVAEYALAVELLGRALKQSPNEGDYRFRQAVALVDLGHAQVLASREGAAANSRKRLLQIGPGLTADNLQHLENYPLYHALMAGH
jgi:hypothetical protein